MVVHLYATYSECVRACEFRLLGSETATLEKLGLFTRTFAVEMYRHQ